MGSKFPFYVGRTIVYSDTEKFSVKAVARVDETRGDWILARCLLLVQVEEKGPELCFTYAQCKKTTQEWQQGAPRGRGKTYVNMFPETLVELVLKAISGDCEGSFEPAKSRLKRFHELDAADGF